MGSKATHQFPVLSELQDTDLFYVVREVAPNVFRDYSAPRSLFPPTIKVATRLITNAEALLLMDNPITLIQPPAADKIIVPLQATLSAIGGTTPYTNNAVFFVGSTANSGTFIMSAFLPDQTYPGVVMPIYTGAGVNQGMIPGDPLRILALGNNPDDGDFDVLVKVYYKLLDA
jgi:hypothetical protein